MAAHSAAFVKAHESAQRLDGDAVSVLTLANAARLARLNAPTIPAPACIEAAVLDVCEDPEEHPHDCTDPCCVPEDEHDLYCVDEGSHVLSHGGQYYGVGQW